MILTKPLNKLFQYALLTIVFVFLTFSYSSEAGVLKTGAKIAIGYAVVTMVKKGVSPIIKKKANQKFWDTVAKYPQHKDEIIDVIKAQAVKHPKYKDDLMKMVSRVEERLGDTPQHAIAKIKKINGQDPINSKYAGKEFSQSKLPSDLKSQGSVFKNVKNSNPYGVPFNQHGIPDFSRYIHKYPGKSTKVKVKYSGDSLKDITAADKASGISKGYRTKNGLTWHHASDDTMILIPRKIHESVRHTGGNAIKKQEMLKDLQ